MAEGAEVVSSSFSAGPAGSIKVDVGTLEMDNALIAARSDRGSTGDAGDIVVQGSNVLLADGATISSSTFGPGRGGTITMTVADTLTITGSSPTLGASGLFSNTSGSGPAGRVIVTAPMLTMDEGKIQSQSNSGSTGDAGKVVIDGGTITLTGGAQISSSTFSAGHGGTVTVTATDALNLIGQNAAGSPSGLFSNTEGTGAAGTVMVQASHLTMQDGANIASSSFSTGAAGIVTVRAGTLEMDNAKIGAQSNPGSTGDAGTVLVEGEMVTLSGGAQISGSSFGAGRGGTVTVHAETLTLDGDTTAITSQSGQGSTGDAGNVVVEGKTITLTDGAQIRSITFGAGHGGTVTVHADALTLDGAGTAISGDSNEGSTGDAGTVVVGGRTVTLSGGAFISSDTLGSGHAGDVTVQVTETLTIRGRDADGNFSAVSSDTYASGAAGRVTVSAPILSMDDTQISSQSNESSTGDAGTVVVGGRNITLTGGAQISSGTFGSGHAGDVTVRASETLTISGHDAFENPSAVFSDTTGRGAAGRVTVSAPTLIPNPINSCANGSGIPNLRQMPWSRMHKDSWELVSAYTMEEGSVVIVLRRLRGMRGRSWWRGSTSRSPVGPSSLALPMARGTGVM
jgi:large exoprotein involved in heme utilization and adhesion